MTVQETIAVFPEVRHPEATMLVVETIQFQDPPRNEAMATVL
jgi:hypothetical protein